MPRKFNCVGCGSEIGTFMRLGEEVDCKTCGKVQIVPEHAKDTSSLNSKPGSDSFESSIKVTEGETETQSAQAHSKGRIKILINSIFCSENTPLFCVPIIIIIFLIYMGSVVIMLEANFDYDCFMGITVALLTLLTIVFIIWPIYCIGLAIKFIRKKEHTKKAKIALIIILLYIFFCIALLTSLAS